MKQNYKNQMIFILILLIGGILTGIFGSKLLDMDVLNKLDVILIPMNDSYDLYSTFIFQFVLQVIYIFIILILGTSLLGSVLIAFIIFTKGFQIGLTCMMFIYTYELKGILGIVLTLIPQVFIDMLPIIIISLFSIEMSNRILFTCLNNHRIKLENELNQGLNYFIYSLISALISSFLKVTLIVMLIRFFNQF